MSFSEPTSTDLSRSRYGNIQEQRLRKPGTHWGLIPKRSLFRSSVLYLSLWESNGSEQEETHYIVTGFQEDFPYCSPGSSLGKQKKVRSTNQQQFCSKDTPVTIEADQIMLALQQLAMSKNLAYFNNKISRTSKLPKYLTTTMPNFGAKSKKLKLFEDLF